MHNETLAPVPELNTDLIIEFATYLRSFGVKDDTKPTIGGTPVGFNMLSWFSEQNSGFTSPKNSFRFDCGTTGCLAGNFAIWQAMKDDRLNETVFNDQSFRHPRVGRAGYDEFTREKMGLTGSQAHDLFHPWFSLNKTRYPSQMAYRLDYSSDVFADLSHHITPEQGAITLEHLARTGEVNWLPAVRDMQTKDFWTTAYGVETDLAVMLAYAASAIIGRARAPEGLDDTDKDRSIDPLTVKRRADYLYFVYGDDQPPRDTVLDQILRICEDGERSGADRLDEIHDLISTR